MDVQNNCSTFKVRLFAFEHIAEAKNLSFGLFFISDVENIVLREGQIADLVCPMMACNVEQAFVSDYAYVIEYVIHHNGDMPKPKILELFPTNYPDYEYDAGIAKTINDYDVI